jgi:hypothetical protein
MPEPDPPKEPVKPQKRVFPRFFVLQIFPSALLKGIVFRNLGPLTKVWVDEQSRGQSKFVPPSGRVVMAVPSNSYVVEIQALHLGKVFAY